MCGKPARGLRSVHCAVAGESEILERAETERGEVVLRRRDRADASPIYEIIFNGVFLMASTNAPSARALALRALEKLEGRTGLRLLIGGLGMGLTLQAAMEYPEVVHVDVVEIEGLIVEWAEDYFGPLNGDALNDERVHVIVGDLAHHLSKAAGSYDAILLDVDNGPSWLVFEENAAIYDSEALERMRTLLAPGGVLAVWAAERTPGFAAELASILDWVDMVAVHEEDERGRSVECYIYRAGTLL